MSQIPISIETSNGPSGNLPDPGQVDSDRASSWTESLAGIFPFLFFGMAVILDEAGYKLLLTVFFYFGYALLLIIAAIAWYKGSPRWSYPYTGFLLLFTWYREDFEMPGVQLFGLTILQPGEFWGWRVWIPFAVAILLVLLAARSWRPLVELFKNMWRDWTMLTFGLYGMIPLVSWWLFDEMHGIWIPISLSAVNLLLMAGALGYLRSGSTKQRVVTLLAGLLPTWPIVILVPAFYWHGRRVPYLSGPINGYSQILPGIIFAAIITLIMFSPGLFKLVIIKIKASQPHKDG